MTKDTVNDYSTTASNNSDVAGQNIAENCSPANLNNAIREGMADLADVIAGNVRATNWYTTSLNVSGTATIGTLSITSLSVSSIAVSGNATVGGTFGTTGNSTFGGTLGVTGAITGSSTITGTTLTGTQLVVTGGAGPANGVYLPAANTLGLMTNSVLRYSINASGALGIGSSPDYGTVGYVMTSAGSGAAPTWAAASSGYTPTGTLATPLNASFPIGAGALVFKAGVGTTNAGGQVSVTFATAFPNAIVGVYPSLRGAPSNSNTLLYYTGESVSGVTIQAISDSGANRASVDIAWFAVGY